MPESDKWNIRKTPRREAQIEEIARRAGIKDVSFAGVIDFALNFTLYGLVPDITGDPVKTKEIQPNY